MQQNYMNKLAKGGSFFLVFTVLNFLLMFGFKVFAARYLEPDFFGVFVLTQTVLNIAGLVAYVGVGKLVTKYVPEYATKSEPMKLSGVIIYSYAMPLLLSLLVSGILYFFAPQLTEFFGFPELMVLGFRVVAVALPFHMIMKTNNNLLLAKKEYFKNRLISSIDKIVLFLGILAIIFFTMPIFFVFYLFFAGLILASLISLLFLSTTQRYFSTANLPEFRMKEWSWFSLYLVFLGTSYLVLRWTDNIMISKFLDAESLGVYSVGISFAAFILMAQNIFGPLILPLFSELKNLREDMIPKFYEKSAIWSFGLGTIIFMVMVGFSRQVINIFFGQEYVGGALIVAIVGFGYLISLLLGFAQQVLIIYDRPDLNFKIDFAVAIYNIMMNFILITIYGLVGAAITTSSSFIIRKLLMYHYAKRFIQPRINILASIKFVVSSGLGVLFVFIVLNFIDGKWFSLISAGVVYLLVTSFMLIGLRVASAEDIVIISQIEKKLNISLSWLKRFL